MAGYLLRFAEKGELNPIPYYTCIYSVLEISEIMSAFIPTFKNSSFYFPSLLTYVM
jgi:hypothetical protein